MKEKLKRIYKELELNNNCPIEITGLLFIVVFTSIILCLYFAGILDQ